jgi:hypothetical protein
MSTLHYHHHCISHTFTVSTSCHHDLQKLAMRSWFSEHSISRTTVVFPFDLLCSMSNAVVRGESMLTLSTPVSDLKASRSMLLGSHPPGSCTTRHSLNISTPLVLEPIAEITNSPSFVPAPSLHLPSPWPRPRYDRPVSH